MNVPRLSILGLFALASYLTANDSNATLGAGGLVPKKSSSIVMESEDLRISTHEIAVRYVFRNTGPTPLDEIVAFPLPEIDGGLVANVPIDIPSSDPLNYIAFKVSAGGVAIKPSMEVRSFFGGAEITNELRTFHLPLSVLDPNVTAAVNKLAPTDRAHILKQGWVDCSLTRDHKCWPYWQSRMQYYWTQHFPAGGSIEVTHTYHPVVGGGTMYSGEDGRREVELSSQYLSRYCPSAESLDRLASKLQLPPGRKYSSLDRGAIAEREIEYILTTANTWSGPIRNFHLSVVSDSAEDIVAACMPDLKRTAPTRYEIHLSNFRPSKEIEILILQPVK